MKIETEIVQQLAAKCLASPDLFLVEVKISDAVRPKITITADGENGISIDQCATLSRCISRGLEAAYGEEASYVLEVSSPGADQPLTQPRQFNRHIGRKLKVKLHDGSEKEGKLEGVTPNGIDLVEEIKEKKSKKATLVPVNLPFEQIAKANVVISFK